MPERRTIRSSMPPRRDHETDFLDETREFWQRRSPRWLSSEDARQIAENVSGFFRVLQEWDASERRHGAQDPHGGRLEPGE